MHNVQPSVYRKGIQPFESTFLLNPGIAFNFSRVGLKSHAVYLNAGDMAKIGALDRDRSAPIKWTRGPPDLIKRTWLNSGVITATIES